MSLFRDDFYSTKVSRWKRKEFGRRGGMGKDNLVMLVAMSAILGGLLAVMLLLLFQGGAGSGSRGGGLNETSLYAGYNEQFVRAIDMVAPAVVSIISSARDKDSDALKGLGMGSGIIFQKDGSQARIVTNNHVVEDSTSIEVTLADGERREAHLVGQDRLTDLAVLEIDGKGVKTVAEFGDSDTLRAGEVAIAIGNPLGGFSQTVTAGIISRPKREIPVSLSRDGIADWEVEMIQTDAAINQGNSGGALISLEGKVIGINSLKVADMGVEGLGFALPINQVKPILEMLVKDRKVKRPFIGVSTQELQYFASGLEVLKLPEDVKNGLIVMEASGPAREAGLRTNDVIVELDGKPVRTMLELRKYLYREKMIGDTLEVTYYRSGKKASTTVTLAESEN